MNNEKGIPIFFASDDNYAPFAASAMVSILENTKSFCEFYVMSNGISDEKKAKISSLKNSYDNFSLEFIDINANEIFRDFSYFPQFTYTGYMRFMIPRVKPEIKKAIYLDVDVIADMDIKELYDTPLDGCTIAAAEDFYLKSNPDVRKKLHLKKDHIYFNSGIILIDTDKFGKLTIKRLIHIKNKHCKKINSADQAILNYIFNGNKYKRLPARFNTFSVCYKKDKDQNRTIIHYLEKIKPWYISPDVDVPGFDAHKLFWNYMRKTEFYEEVCGRITAEKERETLDIIKDRQLNRLERKISEDELKKLWEMFSDILTETDRICGKHNIPYWLDGRTAISAVRGCGFMPGDAELDVGMMRSDYERFLGVLPNELGTDFGVINHQTTPDAYIHFTKICGENSYNISNLMHTDLKRGSKYAVNIFPFDFVPKSKAAESVFIGRIRFLGKLQKIMLQKGSKKRDFLILAGKIFRPFCRRDDKLYTHTEKLMKKYNGRSKKAAPLASDIIMKKRLSFNTNDLLPVKDISFCGKTVKIMKDPDAVLGVMYGDYRSAK